MTVKISLASWDECKEQACALRRQVFVLEQNVPEEMISDAHDAHSMHALVLDVSGTALATGRLLPDGRIGRMAVLAEARGMGVGGHLLQHLMQFALQRGDPILQLSALAEVEGFYTRYGFVRVGEEYAEAGIVHIDMEYRV
jgi:predicted GNAT family N-acyltransferase